MQERPKSQYDLPNYINLNNNNKSSATPIAMGRGGSSEAHYGSMQLDQHHQAPLPYHQSHHFMPHHHHHQQQQHPQQYQQQQQHHLSKSVETVGGPPPPFGGYQVLPPAVVSVASFLQLQGPVSVQSSAACISVSCPFFALSRLGHWHRHSHLCIFHLTLSFTPSLCHNLNAWVSHTIISCMA